ncbi:DUF433 domain-containing protein [Thioalkalivibrio paradoxus]|uniref:DUF433 domain-containing protein n=1 Tax=Thioalkalivibrio paradoxus TaxID=108010 RepID=UPI0038CDC6BA
MRWPVEVVLDLVGSGMTMDEIIADHPELEREDIVACLHYARLLLSGEPVRHVSESSKAGQGSSQRSKQARFERCYP